MGGAGGEKKTVWHQREMPDGRVPRGVLRNWFVRALVSY